VVALQKSTIANGLAEVEFIKPKNQVTFPISTVFPPAHKFMIPPCLPGAVEHCGQPHGKLLCWRRCTCAASRHESVNP